MTSEQERQLMTIWALLRDSNLTLLVATAHFEPGRDSSALRQVQFAEAAQHLNDDAADAAVLAADCNVRREDDALQDELGADAWMLAGSPKNLQWTWSGAAAAQPH